MILGSKNRNENVLIMSNDNKVRTSEEETSAGRVKKLWIMLVFSGASVVKHWCVEWFLILFLLKSVTKIQPIAYNQF